MKLNLMKIEYDIFNEIEYDKIYPSGSAPGHIYGTPKMRKFSSSDSLCPIVQLPNLVRFLCDLLSPNLPKKISDDVASLFTNIPPQETIDIAINLIFNDNPNLNITKKGLKKLFVFARSQTHFIFNSKFYSQINGVAMG